MVQRQIFNRATALWTDDVWAPAELGEAVSQAGSESERGVAPQVVLVALRNAFFVDEAAHWVLDWIIGVAQQEAGQCKTDVAGIFLLSEALPFGKLRTFEVVFQIF